MLLMIDNYDSFTYNLVQYLGELGASVTVVRNDEVGVADIERLDPERIVNGIQEDFRWQRFAHRHRKKTRVGPQVLGLARTGVRITQRDLCQQRTQSVA